MYERTRKEQESFFKLKKAQKTKSPCHQRLQQTNSFINVVIIEKVHVAKITKKKHNNSLFFSFSASRKNFFLFFGTLPSLEFRRLKVRSIWMGKSIIKLFLFAKKYKSPNFAINFRKHNRCKKFSYFFDKIFCDKTWK